MQTDPTLSRGPPPIYQLLAGGQQVRL